MPQKPLDGGLAGTPSRREVDLNSAFERGWGKVLEPEIYVEGAGENARIHLLSVPGCHLVTDHKSFAFFFHTRFIFAIIQKRADPETSGSAQSYIKKSHISFKSLHKT